MKIDVFLFNFLFFNSNLFTCKMWCLFSKLWNTFFWFIFRLFWWFQPWNHWKRFEMNKKGWKRLKKSSSTSFWVRAATKSWSKYTTYKLSRGEHFLLLRQHLVRGIGDSKINQVFFTFQQWVLLVNLKDLQALKP